MTTREPIGLCIFRIRDKDKTEALEILQSGKTPAFDPPLPPDAKIFGYREWSPGLDPYSLWIKVASGSFAAVPMGAMIPEGPVLALKRWKLTPVATGFDARIVLIDQVSYAPQKAESKEETWRDREPLL